MNIGQVKRRRHVSGGAQGAERGEMQEGVFPSRRGRGLGTG